MKYLYALFDSARSTVRNDGFEHAGYLAFLTIFSIFPALLFMMLVLNAFNSAELGQYFISLVLNSEWATFVDILKPRISEITSKPPHGIITFAIIGGVWTISSMIEGLRTSFNRAYRISDTPTYLVRRVISILQFFVITIIAILILFLLTVLPYILNFLSPILQDSSYIRIIVSDAFHNITAYILYIYIFLLLLLMYRFIPNHKSRKVIYVPGTVVAFIFMILLSFGLQWYSTHIPQINLIYGSIGGMIVTMLYFYIINFIIIFGAEFNYSVSRR